MPKVTIQLDFLFPTIKYGKKKSVTLPSPHTKEFRINFWKRSCNLLQPYVLWTSTNNLSIKHILVVNPF